MDERLRQIDVDGLKRIAVYGPESTGKTTLARQLAEHFETLWVPEYARAYIRGKLGRTAENCVLDDILAIAVGQQSAENRAASQATQGLLICDTDLLNIRAYSDLFFGATPLELNAALPFSHYDLYLLTDIDVPWTPDGIRDRPNDRAATLAYFERLLNDYGKGYVKVSGNPGQRLRTAIAAVEARIPTPAASDPMRIG
jgi:HTH-type transcriptional regulator, transcriptional repressor of NAD biosynthesis genes